MNDEKGRYGRLSCSCPFAFGAQELGTLVSDPCPISRRLALGQGSDTSVPSRHSLRSLKIFELYLDMQIISCIIVDGLALLNFLFNYLHYVLGGTGSADRK